MQNNHTHGQCDVSKYFKEHLFIRKMQEICLLKVLVFTLLAEGNVLAVSTKPTSWSGTFAKNAE